MTALLFLFMLPNPITLTPISFQIKNLEFRSSTNRLPTLLTISCFDEKKYENLFFIVTVRSMNLPSMRNLQPGVHLSPSETSPPRRELESQYRGILHRCLSYINTVRTVSKFS
ncbi:hypothetical protein DBV15_08701 [Temnothorax longispinosus]|uniref:Uncharacterized protein n=1 Tax=Temnothorax longispinosus TaxID=300112 RepID=A0A4S2KHX9_9HYME|nr:hypothetical protein DBV15_08701 [Temnothorax longispinosus]